MNRVYLGSGTYGVQAASEKYFNKKVEDLNLYECAVIASLLKAPSRYNPIANKKLSLGELLWYWKIWQKSNDKQSQSQRSKV